MSSAAPKTVQRTPFKRWCYENTGLFFLIPWILGFLIFKAYPFASSLVYSFTDPVSYTHLDVYKRQMRASAPYNTGLLRRRQHYIAHRRGKGHAAGRGGCLGVGAAHRPAVEHHIPHGRLQVKRVIRCV